MPGQSPARTGWNAAGRRRICLPGEPHGLKDSRGSPPAHLSNLPPLENPIRQCVRSTDGGPGKDMPGPFLEDAMKRLSIQLLAGAAFMAAPGSRRSGRATARRRASPGRPKLDGTDFYMFRSYEPGREGYVTLLANYIPLQDVYGGPNFFTLDPTGRLRNPHRQRRRRPGRHHVPVPVPDHVQEHLRSGRRTKRWRFRSSTSGRSARTPTTPAT